MKELKKTITTETIVGYETEDGHVFSTREEAKKYEDTAKHAISVQFQKLMVGEKFAECEIYNNFGYGSEEFMFCVVELKNEEDLKVALMYQDVMNPRGHSFRKFDSSMINKRILVSLGYGEYDEECIPYGTHEELVNQFAKETKKFFENPEVKEEN